ncbi:hypothetical protein [Actinophytocola algeriensis]|uniref:Uncharacterized protein n=1 Tax=Actinophytocola algeriensis TaxID=1768010 RepID=A0A7W7Q8Z9_9PSEU|nr:hypothetical protein [Actinophytocola algeriensis]MBB4909187.1 hypothetical protein [Actinophytocola algeriensis]MBE1474425.1 hypothetical protein [Actinophytocola algeriensis]
MAALISVARREFAAFVVGVGALDAEPLDEHGQGAALADEGDDRDGEGDQDEFGAVGHVGGQ